MAISHLQRSLSNCCRSVFGRGGEEEPEGVSIPAVIRSGGAASRARERRSLLLTEMLREARDCQGHCCDTITAKIDSCSECAKSPYSQGKRNNAHANEASLLLAKHAKEEPPDRGMLALGDRRIAMLVAKPFAVLPMRAILARLPERQASSTDHRALVTKVCRECRQTRTFHRLGSACISLDHGALPPLHPVARVAGRLGTDSLLRGCLVRRDPCDWSHDR